MIKQFVFILALGVFIVSCASNRPLNPLEVGVDKGNVKNETQALWQLIFPEELELVLVNLESKKKEVVQLESGLVRVGIGKGFWQVVGLRLNGQAFETMKTTDRFVIGVKKKATIYAGSVIVQCPTVGSEHFSELKKMKYFNRYHFRSQVGLCEMIVGNDFAGVKEVWKSHDESKNIPLVLGF